MIGRHGFEKIQDMPLPVSPFVVFLVCHLSTVHVSVSLLNIELRRVTGDWGQELSVRCLRPRGSPSACSGSRIQRCCDLSITPPKKADQELVH